MARSESNAVLGKVYHADLNLTHYPEKIDSRIEANIGYNPNMRGFKNLEDYNMAEHVNALSDAVMSIQRSLGPMPFMDKDGVDKGTVSSRIADVENKDYDSRYGGFGWDTTQTIVAHTHTGLPGHPSQIDLEIETQGKLPKGKINTVFGEEDALTGAEIPVSNTDSRKIADAVNDKLSVTQGGTIQKDLEVRGGFFSRLFREWDASSLTGGTLITDYTTTTNQARRANGTAQVSFLNQNIENLLCGKYVIAVRMKTNARRTQELFRTVFYNLGANGSLEHNGTMSIQGTDFDAVNEWQTFYHTVEVKSYRADGYSLLQVIRSATTSNTNVDIDSVIIMPTHPAIYDR